MHVLKLGDVKLTETEVFSLYVAENGQLYVAYSTPKGRIEKIWICDSCPYYEKGKGCILISKDCEHPNPPVIKIPGTEQLAVLANEYEIEKAKEAGLI
jgi:hypothetical protein